MFGVSKNSEKISTSKTRLRPGLAGHKVIGMDLSRSTLMPFSEAPMLFRAVKSVGSDLADVVLEFWDWTDISVRAKCSCGSAAALLKNQRAGGGDTREEAKEKVASR